ncbi:MAG: dTDP-4-amino-4,6-dideoxygalactose transaminase, partial [Anaerolineales bacterium]|nr:dTDP-4-amino-4,6-dideoxygalactose transaminase [Anaerolineales bacterium]
LVEKAITARTRAVVPVHYGGVGCQMDVLTAVAQRHNLVVVEDNAHGLFGQFQGENLGALGQLATLSFHETKNYSCGEGGALLINDPDLIDRAEILREKGTDRSRFFRGEVDKYTWVDVGSSYLLSDVMAAYLLAQLENRQKIEQRRAAIFERYVASLASLALAGKFRLPVIPADVKQSHHLFYLLLNSAEQRDAMLRHFKAQNILAVFHYLPLHLSPMGRQMGGAEQDCPVTEDVSGRLIRLPFYYDLSEDDQARVIEQVYEFFASQ